MRKNQQRMVEATANAGLQLRSHAKMHKCPEVALFQLSQGSSGICCAKVSEAHVMQRAGIEDILITSPVQNLSSIKHLAILAASNTRLNVVIDDELGAHRLNELLVDRGASIGVFIDIDPGLGRTGIAADERLLSLLDVIMTDCDRLMFKGLQVYAGHCMHIADYTKRKDRYSRAMAHGQTAKQLIENRGVSVPVVSGGGTGSFDLESGIGLLTELQAGSYAFMDIEYRDIESETSNQFDWFGIALTLLVTAISQPSQRSITVDAGFKSLASDKMVPEFLDLDGVQYHWGGDEHGIISLNNPSRSIQLGETLELVTPHCDPTVNLHDFYFVKEQDVIELWPISARGCSR
jgi:D-serine deaminase-like pyridoxal phosphate-dependent protein